MIDCIETIISNTDKKYVSKNRHTAILNANKKWNVLLEQMNYTNINCTIGHNTNCMRYNSKMIGTHAETQALTKLSGKMVKFGVKNITVDLLVFQCDNYGNIKDSMPCYHCAIELRKHKKIKINNLHYTVASGEIISINFDKWFNETAHHITAKWDSLARHRIEKHGVICNCKW